MSLRTWQQSYYIMFHKLGKWLCLILISLGGIFCSQVSDYPFSYLNYSSNKQLTSFRFERSLQPQALAVDAEGSIDEAQGAISITVPTGTTVTGLIASYTSTGFMVSVGSTAQYSRYSENNFTAPVVYRVTADDGSTKDYTVTVSTNNPAAQAPEAYDVKIIGVAKVGQWMLGSYKYSDVNYDAESGSTFQWLRADTLDGLYAPIGTSSTTYKLTAGELNKFIKFSVIPKNLTAPTDGTEVFSAAIGAVGSATLDNCWLTINEWADVTGPDYIEIKNFSNQNIVLKNDSFQVEYGSSTLSLSQVVETGLDVGEANDLTTEATVIAPGEIFLITGSPLTNPNLVILREDGFLGKVLIATAAFSLSTSLRLDDIMVNLTDGINDWSHTPTPANFATNVGTNLISQLKPSYNCQSSATTATLNWQNGSETIRSAGKENVE